MDVGTQLTALADPTRRAIFELLRAQPRAVGELSSKVPVSQPAVSQHLKVLREAALVRSHPVGASRVYEVDGDGLLVLRDWLDSMWDQALDAFVDAAHRPDPVGETSPPGGPSPNPLP